MYCPKTLRQLEAQNEEARTIMVQYTGHVGSGGLQGHSVGALYPYMVYGQETTAGTRYGVKNTCGDFDSGPRFTCAEAYTVAEFNAGAKHGRPLTDEVRAAYVAVIDKYTGG